MYAYDTVTETLSDLSKRGYAASFKLSSDCSFCQDRQVRLNANEFDIDELYRFEGETDPADETIVYAISSADVAIKGTLVNAYGAYSDSASKKLVSKLNIKRV
jgi:hypothetical protein